MARSTLNKGHFVPRSLGATYICFRTNQCFQKTDKDPLTTNLGFGRRSDHLFSGFAGKIVLNGRFTARLPSRSNDSVEKVHVIVLRTWCGSAELKNALVSI